MGLGWQAIAGGVGLMAILFAIWYAFRIAEKRGRAEAEREASEKAREVEADMAEIQSETRTPDELLERLKTGKFGGQK